MDVGLLTAFLGGFLALLSPCGALLLPAFFASTVGSGSRLILHGGIFYAGLLVVLVPLGIGAGALGAAFVTHRALIIGLAAATLVALGTMQVFGIGFDLARALPGANALQRRASASVGILKTFLLGAASGVAGFCAGPILGAVLTLAAAQGQLLSSALLLALYGAGMVVPLVLIAAFWHRMGDRVRARLRGRTFTIGGRTFHTTSVVSGLLIIAVGLLFWFTNGLVTLPALLPTSVSAWLQGQSSVLANGWIDLAVALALIGGIGTLWWRAATARAARRAAEAAAPTEQSGP